MPYPALSVANYFIQRGGAEGLPVDPMKLQKLIYIAHGWNLAINGEPLIREGVEAWDYGPVIGAVYQTFKSNGRRPIQYPREPERFSISPEDREVRAVLDRVWDVYGEMSAVQLSNLTHQEGTPWSRARKSAGPFRRSPRIDDDDIRDHFRKLALSRREAS